MGPFLAHTRAIAVGWRQPVAWIALAGWAVLLAWATTMWATLDSPFPEHLAAPIAAQMGAILAACIGLSDRGVWADFVVKLPALPISTWKRRCATCAAVLAAVVPAFLVLTLVSPVTGAAALFEVVLVGLGAAVGTRWIGGDAEGVAGMLVALVLGAVAAQVWLLSPLSAGLLSCLALTLAVTLPVWRPTWSSPLVHRDGLPSVRVGRSGRVRLLLDGAWGLGLACALSALALLLVSLLPSWRIDDVPSGLLLTGAGACVAGAAMWPLGAPALSDAERGRSAWTWLPVDQRWVALALYVHGFLVATAASLVVVSIIGVTGWQDVLPGVAASAWAAAGYAAVLVGRIQVGAGLLLAAMAGGVAGVFLLGDPPVWLTPSLFAALAVAGVGAGWASTVFRMPR